MSNELKDCPFCGGKPVMETYQTLVSILCDQCGVARAFRGPLSGARTVPLHTGSAQCRFTHPQEDYSHQAIEDAVVAWNSRAAIAHQPPKEALTDAQIRDIWCGLGGQERWLKDFGFIQFAHAIEAATAPNAKLVEALRELYRGYVRLLESGRDKIIELGGDCDPVDRMKASDPELRKARAALAAAGVKGE